MGETLIFYDDSEEFGGHEQELLDGLEAAARGFEERLVCFFCPQNEALTVRLRQLSESCPRLTLAPVPRPSRSFQAFRNLMEGRLVEDLARRIEGHRPLAVVVFQGNIEISSRGLLAAARLGCPRLSSMPLAQSFAAMGARGGWWRDQAHRFLYRLPTGWIASSVSCRRQLRARGATQPVRVVYPRVRSFPACAHQSQGDARRALGLRAEGTVAGCVGRFDLRQKRQHLLVLAMDEAAGWQLLLVGAGAGRGLSALSRLISRRGLSDRVRIQPWSDRVETIYPALDLLVLPSRYEGLPLVMLEAMLFGLPILAAAVDGMSEFLPREWLLDTVTPASLARALRGFRAQPELVERNRQLVQERFSREKFEEDFCGAIRQLAFGDAGD